MPHLPQFGQLQLNTYVPPRPLPEWFKQQYPEKAGNAPSAIVRHEIRLQPDNPGEVFLNGQSLGLNPTLLQLELEAQLPDLRLAPGLRDVLTERLLTPHGTGKKPRSAKWPLRKGKTTAPPGDDLRPIEIAMRYLNLLDISRADDFVMEQARTILEDARLVDEMPENRRALQGFKADLDEKRRHFSETLRNQLPAILDDALQSAALNGDDPLLAQSLEMSLDELKRVAREGGVEFSVGNPPPGVRPGESVECRLHLDA